jgi:hypothetical protein
MAAAGVVRYAALRDGVLAGGAVIVTQPGSKSHQNAQRRGFDLLCTRAVLVKHRGFAAVGVQHGHHAAITRQP